MRSQRIAAALTALIIFAGLLLHSVGLAGWSSPTGTGGGGGSGTLDHAALTSNLAWTSSGHTGTASRIAGFDGSGNAAVLTYGETGNTTVVRTTAGGLLQPSILPVATTATQGAAKIRPMHLTLQQAGGSAGGQWTNMPAAKANLFGVGRQQTADLTNFTEARLAVCVDAAGAAGAQLAVQYSTDGGSTWKYLDDTADGAIGSATPKVSIASSGVAVSAWMTLAAAARADVRLRVVGDTGDGAVDPSFFFIELEVR
jgi:hypothetical protein